MKNGDRVAFSLPMYAAIDRQDPEMLLQPQQTVKEVGGEVGGKKDRQCCEADKFIHAFFVVFLKL